MVHSEWVFLTIFEGEILSYSFVGLIGILLKTIKIKRNYKKYIYVQANLFEKMNHDFAQNWYRIYWFPVYLIYIL